MTSIIKLSGVAALGALLAAPLAMAQQNKTSGTSHGISGQTSHGMSAADTTTHRGVGTPHNQNANAGSGSKANLMPGSTNHDAGMANANSSAYHGADPNTNNGWNSQNTGDTSANSPQRTGVNTGSGQSRSSNR
jgi:hypothetical protein